MTKPPYSNSATKDAPAIVVLLLDLSASMYKPFDSIQTRSDYMFEGIHSIAKKAIIRSLKGSSVDDRYKFAAFGYSNEAYCVDIWHGVKGISDISKSGLPTSFSQPKAMSHGFKLVRDFLYHTISFLPYTSPAPMVIHFTDGEFPPGMTDPKPIIDEIKQIESPDGSVLVETIVCSDKCSEEEFQYWDQKKLLDERFLNLVQISSTLPNYYCQLLQNYGEKIQVGTPLLFPIKWKIWTEILPLPITS